MTAKRSGRRARTPVLRSIHGISASAAAVVAIVGVAACGSGISDSVVVRVGETAITKATVDHWMSAMAGGRAAIDPSKRQTLRRQALGFLISSQWLVGEAAEDGLKLSERELEQRFKAKQSASFPGGEAELREFLKATGQKISDIMFEVKAELASSQIRQMLMGREPAIARARIVAYYGRHQQRFAIPEQRELQITNRKSTAEADRLKREVESGKSSVSMFLRDLAERPLRLPRYDVLERAIYSAKPNVLIGPVKQGIDYYLFEVKRITPAGEQTLAQVQGSIERQLAAEQRRRTLAAFIKAWRKKWISRTDCQAGYVVQKCRQYKASAATPPEDPFTLN
jgi:foldase protein PrsA